MISHRILSLSSRRGHNEENFIIMFYIVYNTCYCLLKHFMMISKTMNLEVCYIFKCLSFDALPYVTDH